MDFVLAGFACVGWVTWLADHGAAEENTEVLVQVGQEHARKAVSNGTPSGGDDSDALLVG